MKLYTNNTLNRLLIILTFLMYISQTDFGFSPSCGENREFSRICILINLKQVFFFWASVSLAIFCIIYSFLVDKYEGGLRRIINAYLEHFMKDKLQGQRSVNRVTLYKVEKGYVFIFRYFLRFFRNFRIHRIKKENRYYLKNAPWNIFVDYLTQFSRKGHPHESGTMTYFKLPDSENDIDGFVSWVYFEGSFQYKNLPNVKEIIAKLIKGENLKRTEKNTLAKYQELGKMKDIEKLKRVHRFCEHIWATPINIGGGAQWGVLVVDSVNRSNVFRESDRESITELQKAISPLEHILGVAK